eukprot:5490493-Heterocapsa_arctica.AAC.1
MTSDDKPLRPAWTPTTSSSTCPPRVDSSDPPEVSSLLEQIANIETKLSNADVAFTQTLKLNNDA